jgi:hypothetical protein
MCCKRRVLEFEEFLKIEGCKKGKHLFVKKKQDDLVCDITLLLALFPSLRPIHVDTQTQIHMHNTHGHTHSIPRSAFLDNHNHTYIRSPFTHS